MMTADSIFIDTNILLRATIADFPQHETISNVFFTAVASYHAVWISRQVIREFIAQATRPQNFTNKPLTAEQIKPLLKQFRNTLSIANETDDTTEMLVRLLERHPVGGKQVHDANIVATMLVNGIKNLLTLNHEDFKRYSQDITVIVP